MSEPISWRQFFWTQAIAVLVVLAGGYFEIDKTNRELQHLRTEEGRNHASTALKETVDAVSKIREQLQLHADMFNELASCMSSNTKQTSVCWHKPFDFNPTEADQTWDKLQ